MRRGTQTAKERVLRMYPQAWAEWSEMYGWRIVNHGVIPQVPLNRGCKSEAAAWRSIAARHC